MSSTTNHNGKAKVESGVFDTIHDLREVPLSSRDFTALRNVYGASKFGTNYLALVYKAATPSYRCAAQMDLDKFHRCDEHVLEWDDLLSEMEPDDRTPEEVRNDQLAMTLDKG